MDILQGYLYRNGCKIIEGKDDESYILKNKTSLTSNNRMTKFISRDYVEAVIRQYIDKKGLVHRYEELLNVMSHTPEE